MRTIYSHMENKSVKLPFVTKNSKHLMGTGADDFLALIEFTPLWKTKASIYPLKLKNKNISLYLHATITKQSLPTLTIVKVRTVSNSNSLVSSKHVLRTRSDDSWPLIEFTLCEKRKYQVTFVTKNKNIWCHLHSTNSQTASKLKTHLGHG